jgi:hypothetical protein
MNMISERLLHFIWQFQYFDKKELTTTTGEAVQIIFPGQYNANQGPDFSDAKIKVGKEIWAGAVELHIHTSDWTKHKHTGDTNYNNVILHVVWEDGTRNSVPVTERSSVLPTIELNGRIPLILLQRYEELMNSEAFVPCEKLIHTVRDITWRSWKERLLAERLMRKSALAEAMLKENNYHWEETFWWMLARNFGIKVNADAFEAIARSIPVNVLAKHKQQIHQLEALLLGQGGLLKEDFTDDYPKMLQKEYQFLQHKYNLKPINMPLHFLRMRPGNFPTIRLAQLAMLVQSATHLFSKIKEVGKLKEIKEWFNVTANDYWHYHYQFDENSNFKKKKLGETMIDNFIINTIAPLLFTYGGYHAEQVYKDKAIKWLEQTAAETNSITKGFAMLGVENKNAFDSQALIELKNEYCNKKRCLECGVGNGVLKTN